jgi:hypothetical protein
MQMTHAEIASWQEAAVRKTRLDREAETELFGLE